MNPNNLDEVAASTSGTTPALWPLFSLRITTDRLELRPVTDTDLDPLAALARRGIHDPGAAPWASLWTNRRGRDLDRAFAQYFWSQRALWSPTSWTLPFAVRSGGVLVGVQQIEADDFPTLRTVNTSAWLGRAFQGAGIGTEMRRAVLAFAFDALGAEAAGSSAFGHNAASIRVSEKLGYRRNGVQLENVGGRPVEAVQFRLERPQWNSHRPVDAVVDGLDACLELLGVPGGAGRLTAVV